MEITNLPTLPGTPDTTMIATKDTDFFEGTPLAGMLPPFPETAVIGRMGTRVAVVFAATPWGDEEILGAEFPDVELAEVNFANALDTLRTDGWKVREPDPWETPDPLASDAPLPF
jgi:hypothetical protein